MKIWGHWAHLFLNMFIGSPFPAFHHCAFNLVCCDGVAEPNQLGLLDPGVWPLTLFREGTK